MEHGNCTDEMPITRKRKTTSNTGIMSTTIGLTEKEYVLATINAYILKHSKNNKLTTWNAFMKLSEEKAFKSLMRKWFDSPYKLNQFFKYPEKIKAFYKNNIKRGNAKVKKIATTKAKYFTRRKKR
jgi:transposase-like protein